MRLIKQNDTSKPIVFLMVDSADHITGKTGLTPTVTISKNGGAFAAPSGAVSEIGNGWYKLTPAAADVDTLGPLIIHATATGADPTDVEYQVVARDPYTNQTDLNMDQALPASPTPNTVGASLVAANQEGQPTAVLFPVTPPFVDLPASGTKMCRIWLLVFDGNMQPLDLAANPTVTAENHAGQDRSAKLGPVVKETGSVGRYYVDYTASASDAEECIYVRVNFSYNGIDRQQIVSMVAVRDLGG
ncbi:MAG: hypothetical protein KatS3mg087_2059 [Patescibacteria group bacterium]|nr:MAG: hypothetical protein KatS3mg087_2059 [Patescibacteria group bacterium]